jgi:hypothetical protein
MDNNKKYVKGKKNKLASRRKRISKGEEGGIYDSVIKEDEHEDNLYYEEVENNSSESEKSRLLDDEESNLSDSSIELKKKKYGKSGRGGDDKSEGFQGRIDDDEYGWILFIVYCYRYL